MPNDGNPPPPSSAKTSDSPHTQHIGRIFEDRYEILEWIGSGGYGNVWKAKDRIVGENVAFKWMHAALGAVQPRVRREITILRLLRYPGVVRLIDDGVADGKPFLVMELVNGKPFPGISANESKSWPQLASSTLALLETLSHVHATGVIHRDLKPDNVLVRPDGRPVVLDFGISQLHTPGSDLLIRRGIMAGSPLYMAPEQISNGSLDPRVDLYAIGVMLYEALTGHVPHHSHDIGDLWRSRLSEAVRPVQELAPTLPAIVASVINRLLATRAEDRFDSAADVLAALRGDTMTTHPMVSFLGPQERLVDLTNALEHGQSIDIVGPHGSGRTRWLHEIANRLAERGRTGAWIYPSKSPLGSLLPLVGEPIDAHRLRLDEALVWAENAVSQLLENGTILMVDDAEQIDAWSADILFRCRSKAGAVLRAFLTAPTGIAATDIVTIHLLDQLSLHSLFAGPDRLFHLREDAAQALWERTHGHPGQIELELLSWTRMGLARRDGHILVVDREALGRLQTGLVGVRIATATDSDFVLDDPQAKDVLRWLSLAGCPLSMAQLATLMQSAPFRVEAACQGLLQRRMVKTSGEDHYEVRWRIPVVQDETQRLQSHKAIAFVLSPGDDMRLYHLLAAGLPLEAAQESVIVGARHAKAGNIGAAVALLAEGLRAARDERTIIEETRILILWAKTALADGTPRAIDRVLYELSRTRSTDPTLARLQPLLRAAIAAPLAGGIHALDIANELGPFSDPELERWRHRIRVTAVAVRAQASMIADVLIEVDDWVDQSDEPLAQLTLAEGRARQRYHEGKFEDAAALYVRAADLETSTPGRIDSMLRSASALLEAFRHDEAIRIADEAFAIAARFRNPYWEGRAEWLLRSAQYRTRQTQGADMELVHATSLVGTDDLEALVCLNEAAAAMRANHIDQARDLANRAATIWRSLGRPYATTIARALAITCGAATDINEAQALAARAITCKGLGLGIQTLGLLGRVFPELIPGWQHAIDGLVNDIPKTYWASRMDVLSVNEALAGATGNQPPEPLH
jgi:serine/threonine protein kinase/tetratricopeptide (TPR) repeat protein